MPHIRSAGTTSSLATMLHANHEHLGMEAAAVGAEALAYVCDTEDFGMYRVRKQARRDVLMGGRGDGGEGRWER